ncbi:hypothetical protein BI081_gp001 [Mycobacterium phage Tonenili]|uniref:Uncharacterized protein n=1 Tax=Mycobacterium phage Tonenili TaxID=1891703 RepID=A0A1C9EGX8_9CAUD|nr:hypothetical protein BI081_gp001 [Mycobacterium phage Tonenili]AON96752.1 hypothetical protein SEA_TONENILI_1 [Mycobacterium phage Tonenili]
MNHESVRVEIPSDLLPLVYLVAEDRDVSPHTVALAWMITGAEKAVTVDDIKDMAARQGERVSARFLNFLSEHAATCKKWFGRR